MRLRALIVVTVLSVAASAGAETRREYVRRVVLVLGAAERMESWVERNVEDLGLCSIAQALAERGAELARHMVPPPELRDLHPHLLMAIENAERAFFFASSGDVRQFRHHLRVARQERRILLQAAQEEGIDLTALM